jgi:hypothetical protein
MKELNIDDISVNADGSLSLGNEKLEELASIGAAQIAGAGTNQRCDRTSNSGCRNTRSCEGSTNTTCVNGSYLYKCEGVSKVY